MLAVVDQKRFQTLRAQFALLGYSLFRSDGTDGPARHYVERLGTVQPVASIEVAQAFLERLRAPTTSQGPTT